MSQKFWEIPSLMREKINKRTRQTTTSRSRVSKFLCSLYLAKLPFDNLTLTKCTFQLSERNLDLVSSKALVGKNGIVSNGIGGTKLDPLNHHPTIQPKAFLSSTSPAASDARRAHSILNNNVIASSTCTTNDDSNSGNANNNLNSQSQLLPKAHCAPTIRATLSSAADNRNNNVR